MKYYNRRQENNPKKWIQMRRRSTNPLLFAVFKVCPTLFCLNLISWPVRAWHNG